MTFLFIATLGPVQPFIASSRRTLDLFAGSTLLSELSKAAAHKIAEEADIDSLIFPAPSPATIDQLLPNTALNVANKIVAIVEREPAVLGREVKEAIDRRLEAVKEAAFKTLTQLDENVVNKQISNLVEYSWVAVPMNGEHTYEDTREYAEAILAARKNTVFFHPVTWGSHEDKSSIDGRLESVIPSTYYPRYSDTEGIRDGKIKYLYDNYKAGPHERLSAVDLLKRLGFQLPLRTVHSTSHIAATPFLERLCTLNGKDTGKAKGLWGKYIWAVRELAPYSSIVEDISLKLSDPHPITGNVDGALFFEERLWEDVVYRDKFKTAQDALKDFFDFTDTRLDGVRPSPYYVVLLADGDGMGKAIEAQAAAKPDELDGEGHRKISRALACFAESVSAIVKEQYKGELVYAGGDDVLALLPLDTALACARELSDAFKKALQPFKDKDGHTPTLSAGMAVVHHISLLQDALALARAAEHKAKDQPEKNALAIHVQKRSGEPVDIVVAFPPTQAQKAQQDQPIPAPWPPIEEFEILIELCKVGIIPGGMAYELRDMLQRLQTTRDNPDYLLLQEVIRIEAARIIRRKVYFSQQHVAARSPDQLKKLLLKLPHDQSELEEDITRQIQARALAFMLTCIGVKQDATKGFIVTSPAQSNHQGSQSVQQHESEDPGTRDINPFIDALIVAQVFAETLLPGATKGDAE